MIRFSGTPSTVALALALAFVAGPAMSAGNDAPIGGTSGVQGADEKSKTPALRESDLDRSDFFGGKMSSNLLFAAAESDASTGGTSDEQKSAEKPKTTAQPEESTDSLGSAITSGSLFGGSTATGAAQQSVTAGYELGGAGVAGGRMPGEGRIMTSPAKGSPVRFDSGIYVYPAATLGYGHNDNLLSQPSNRVSSSLWVLRPEAVAELKNHGDRYTLSYSGNYARYASSSADNFEHHEFWAAGDNFLTSRARIGWGVGFLDRTDPRGSTDRASSAVPDRWTAPVARVLGIYGAPGATGRIELEGSVMQKRYQNNRDFTQVADVDISTFSGRFFYRFMPKTSMVFEARETKGNYISPTSTNSNTDRRLYTGLVWEATAKTTGSFKVGRAYKDYESSSRTDASMTSWEGGLRYSPLTYSTFDLVSSRAPQDSTGLGSFLINKATSLTWNHKWATFMSSRVNVGVMKTEFVSDPRIDQLKLYGIGFFRELGVRTRLGLNWDVMKRDSNNNLYDFKRNTVMLTLEGTL